MTKYIISNKFAYLPQQNAIKIGGKHLDKLSDNSLSEYIAESLMHEHIHRVLHKYFNIETSALFDAIEHLFINLELHHKYIDIHNKNEPNNKIFAFIDTIKENGFSSFLNYYGITKDDIVQSKYICNNRGA